MKKNTREFVSSSGISWQYLQRLKRYNIWEVVWERINYTERTLLNWFDAIGLSFGEEVLANRDCIFQDRTDDWSIEMKHLGVWNPTRLSSHGLSVVDLEYLVICIVRVRQTWLPFILIVWQSYVNHVIEWQMLWFICHVISWLRVVTLQWRSGRVT